MEVKLQRIEIKRGLLKNIEQDLLLLFVKAKQDIVIRFLLFFCYDKTKNCYDMIYFYFFVVTWFIIFIVMTKQDIAMTWFLSFFLLWQNKTLLWHDLFFSYDKTRHCYDRIYYFFVMKNKTLLCHDLLFFCYDKTRHCLIYYFFVMTKKTLFDLVFFVMTKKDILLTLYNIFFSLSVRCGLPRTKKTWPSSLLLW